jgi:hypothetical protein
VNIMKMLKLGHLEIYHIFLTCFRCIIEGRDTFYLSCQDLDLHHQEETASILYLET